MVFNFSFEELNQLFDDVPCPRCGAEAEQPCRSYNRRDMPVEDRVVVSPHRPRMLAWKASR